MILRLRSLMEVNKRLIYEIGVVKIFKIMSIFDFINNHNCHISSPSKNRFVAGLTKIFTNKD